MSLPLACKRPLQHVVFCCHLVFHASRCCSSQSPISAPSDFCSLQITYFRISRLWSCCPPKNPLQQLRVAFLFHETGPFAAQAIASSVAVVKIQRPSTGIAFDGRIAEAIPRDIKFLLETLGNRSLKPVSRGAAANAWCGTVRHAFPFPKTNACSCAGRHLNAVNGAISESGWWSSVPALVGRTGHF